MNSKKRYKAIKEARHLEKFLERYKRIIMKRETREVQSSIQEASRARAIEGMRMFRDSFYF
jgi:hypothetical protein